MPGDGERMRTGAAIGLRDQRTADARVIAAPHGRRHRFIRGIANQRMAERIEHAIAPMLRIHDPLFEQQPQVRVERAPIVGRCVGEQLRIHLEPDGRGELRGVARAVDPVECKSEHATETERKRIRIGCPRGRGRAVRAAHRQFARDGLDKQRDTCRAIGKLVEPRRIERPLAQMRRQ